MQKNELISYLIKTGYLKTKIIIDAFYSVPREEFVLPEYKKYAYTNDALPLIEGQTISQPLTVAVMTEALQPEKGNKILEIGTGSGYQAAILSHVVGSSGKVITVERIPSLVVYAKERLKAYKNVSVFYYDGTNGYPPKAPYDRIIVTASSPALPPPLLEQLKPHGKIVIPIRDEMFLIEKNSKLKKTFLGNFLFVPLIGKYGFKK